MDNKMIIEIWSDTACPYCYIGKKRFEAVLNSFEYKDQISVVWRSYELDPSLPKSPLNESHYAYLAKGQNRSEDDVRKTTLQIKELGKKVGVEFNFDQIVTTNTSDALRLVKIAKKYDKADETEELLFKAYFTDGESVSDRALLLNIAQQLGISQSEVNDVLDSEVYLDEIKEDMRYSENELRLNYIPFYRFNQKSIIQGVIEAETYLDILTKAFEDWKSNGIGANDGDSISGKACSIDGVCSL